MAAIREAKQAGASGVIWFAHPQSAPADAYSEAHLSSLLMGRQPKPALRQRVDPGGSIVLTNEGTGDVLLLPGAQLHAWRVEANASMKFADPAPGEFVEMQPAGVLVEPEALSHIELYYSKLPAGGSIRSAAGTIGNSPKK